MVDNSKRLSYGGSFVSEEGSGSFSLTAAIASGVLQVEASPPERGRYTIIASDYTTGSMGPRPAPIVTIEKTNGITVATFAPDLADAIDAAIHDVRFGLVK